MLIGTHSLIQYYQCIIDVVCPNLETLTIPIMTLRIMKITTTLYLGVITYDDNTFN